MGLDIWLPKGWILPNGSKVRKIVSSGDLWQILLLGSDSFLLVVKPELLMKWVSFDLINANLFETIDIQGKIFKVFISKYGYLISSIEQGPYPNNNIQGRAFAIALRESRKASGTLSLHDAVYIEQISRLLPTFTLTDGFDDQTVLGTWLTAGVRISISSHRRLYELLRWMEAKEVDAIINEAGFPCISGNTLVKPDKQQSEEIEVDTAAQLKKNINTKTTEHNMHFTLTGRAELEAFFNDNIVDIIVNEEKYHKMGIEFPGAIVMHGPPGCGKTFAAERLVEFLDWPCYSINSASIGSPFIHDTSKKISELFDKAISNPPSVILIDEMEAFLTDRGAGQSAGSHHLEEVAEFLRRIPEATKKHVLVIAMTNMLDSIDPAILRRGRFDHIIEVKMPSAGEIRMLLTSLFSKLPVSADLDMDDLACKLENHPLSDVSFVVKEAGRITVKHDKNIIDNQSVELAFSLLPPEKNKTSKIGF